jgi:DNA repair protein RadD
METEEPEPLPVEYVGYSLHRKYGKPDSLKVSYHCGLRYPVNEWVSFNSDKDFAVRKARQWWRMRSMHEIPETIEEAVKIGDLGGIASPLWITVEKQNGYDRVADCELEPTPPVVDITPPEPEMAVEKKNASKPVNVNTQAVLPF